jgi:hypothetical protein
MGDSGSGLPTEFSSGPARAEAGPPPPRLPLTDYLRPSRFGHGAFCVLGRARRPRLIPVLAMARFVSWAVRDGPVSSPFWPWRVLCPGPCATAPSHPRFPSLTDRVAMLPVSCRRWWWPWPCFASVVRGSLDVFTSTARHGPYLLVRLRVRPERHRAQSCVIALRSPAPERSSEYSDIHQIFTPSQCTRHNSGGGDFGRRRRSWGETQRRKVV